MSKSKRRRAGRKRVLDAKSRATTAEGQGRLKRDEGPERLLSLRRRISGDASVGFGFPLDILASHGLISGELRDEGVRFSMLAWWLYGSPAASVEGFYERLVAAGVGSEYGPRPEGEEADADQLRHIRSQKARYERMVGALEQKPARIRTVKRFSQFFEIPGIIRSIVAGQPATVHDLREITSLAEGLARLLQLRQAEDRYRSKLDARAVHRSSTAECDTGNAG